MSSVNSVTIVGRVGRDPETRYSAAGDAITNVTVATSESWKDKKTGEKKEQTEWHRITFFGKLAEIAGQYLEKGSLIYVEGSLRTNKYTDKDGIEKYSTDIRANTMKMLGGKREPQPDDAAQQAMGVPKSHQVQQQRQAARPAPDFSDMDESIPF